MNNWPPPDVNQPHIKLQIVFDSKYSDDGDPLIYWLIMSDSQSQLGARWGLKNALRLFDFYNSQS